MPGSETANLHGSCVAIAGIGVLLTGPSGSGKSDLALRLIDQSGQGTGNTALESRLVADDRIVVRNCGSRLIAAPPASLAGLLEVRGQGILKVDHLPEVALCLAVRLMPSDEIERMPEAAASHFELLGVQIPSTDIDPSHASAASRVRSAVCKLKGHC